MQSVCEQCEVQRAEIAVARARIAELETRLHEAEKLAELQQADLERYRKAYEASAPNHPERVARDQLQLAFERVLESLAQTPVVNDAADAADAADSAENVKAAQDALAALRGAAGGDRGGTHTPKRRSRHGRRPLDLTNLPVEELRIDPPDVEAAGGKGFRHIGDEISSRVAHRPASYFRLRIVRRKFVREDDTPASEIPTSETASSDAAEQSDAATSSDTRGATEPVATSTSGCVVDGECDADVERVAVLIAPLPESVWPKMMAEPSAIADIIISKYSDSLPLNRQESISNRHGFVVPRSTQCGWLKAASPICEPIVDAMFGESRRQAFCIATDSTSASMRAKGEYESWHVFVFVADRDHVVFRYSHENTSAAVSGMLTGFRGHLLADAASVYDAIIKTGDVIEVGCWMHCRRYAYRALETDRERALEALAIIGAIFEIDNAWRAKGLELSEFTEQRAKQARPLLELLDQWVVRNKDAADPRGPLAKFIGYYQNQHDALWRFVQDGRLSIDNGVSERSLRNLVLGELNWMFFANETGLRWYSTFRSLIASCILHGLNAQLYMEELLRLAPHWPMSRVLELSPKYWPATRQRLDARQRAIITRPWEREPPTMIMLPSRAPPPSVNTVPATLRRAG